MEVPTDSERQFAKKVADLAMICGWERAIRKFAAPEGLKRHEVVLILNKCEKYNDMADPNGRIHSLDDWKREKLGVARLSAARGTGKTPRVVT